MELTPESREITTFVIDEGLFRFKRLIFGISSASEIFQSIVQESLEGCDAHNISHDIIVGGKGQEDHDTKLEAVLTRLEDSGYTINDVKSMFSKTKLVYVGHKLSADGFQGDDTKIRAVCKCDIP